MSDGKSFRIHAPYSDRRAATSNGIESLTAGTNYDYIYIN